MTDIGEFRAHKYTELDFVYVMYLIYRSYGHVVDIDKNLTSNNCNYKFLSTVDTCPTTIAQHTCIPEEVLRIICRETGILVEEDNDLSKGDVFEKLVEAIGSDQLDRLASFLREKKVTSSRIRFVLSCFKPFHREPKCWLHPFDKPLGKNKRRESDWIGNFLIDCFLVPFCHQNKIKYVGVLYLNFVSKAPLHRRREFFNEIAAMKDMKNKIVRNIRRGYRKFIILVDCFDHWSPILIDYELNGTAFHYNSHGYCPDYFTPNKCLSFYSYEKGYVPHKGKKEVTDMSIRVYQDPIDWMFQFMLCELECKRIVINVEQSQMQDGECGMFSLVFLFYLLDNYPPEGNVDNVYNLFKFTGDRRIQEFRNVFFTNVTSARTEHRTLPTMEYNKRAINKLKCVLDHLENIVADKSNVPCPVSPVRDANVLRE